LNQLKRIAKANSQRNLAFSENWQSLCRIKVAPFSGDETDSCQYLTSERTRRPRPESLKILDLILNSVKSFSVQPLGSLRLCGCEQSITTETQRTQRTHREEAIRARRSSRCLVRRRYTRSPVHSACHGDEARVAPSKPTAFPSHRADVRAQSHRR